MSKQMRKQKLAEIRRTIEAQIADLERRGDYATATAKRRDLANLA